MAMVRLPPIPNHTSQSPPCKACKSKAPLTPDCWGMRLVRTPLVPEATLTFKHAFKPGTLSFLRVKAWLLLLTRAISKPFLVRKAHQHSRSRRVLVCSLLSGVSQLREVIYIELASCFSLLLFF